MIEMIAAMSKNEVIGKEGSIPWRLPDDFKQFKEATTGHPIIMGLRTYQSIGKPLPGRTNIVLSDTGEPIEGCEVVGWVRQALDVAREAPGSGHIFIIGGESIYRQFAAHASKIRLTVVDTVIEGGDTHFPKLNPVWWDLVKEEPHEIDDRHPYRFVIKHYEKKHASVV